MLGHVGEGGGTSGAMFGGNIGPFHAVRAVTVAKRREYDIICVFCFLASLPIVGIGVKYCMYMWMFQRCSKFFYICLCRFQFLGFGVTSRFQTELQGGGFIPSEKMSRIIFVVMFQVRLPPQYLGRSLFFHQFLYSPKGGQNHPISTLAHETTPKRMKRRHRWPTVLVEVAIWARSAPTAPCGTWTTARRRDTEAKVITRTGVFYGRRGPRGVKTTRNMEVEHSPVCLWEFHTEAF